MLAEAAAQVAISPLKLEAGSLTSCRERSHDSFARVAYSLGLCRIISSGNYVVITYIPLQFHLDVIKFCVSCPKLLSVRYVWQSFHSVLVVL